VPFYLPLLSRRCLVRGRALDSQVPLFAGYLFLRAQRHERGAVLPARRVVRCLEVPDQQGLWRDLKQIHHLIAAGLPVTPEDRLAPGHIVEIRSGPLAGLTGKIVRSASGQRFVVEVDFIQRGAAVLLDGCCLAPTAAPDARP
jgi:transcriptional antiterminator RfaH